MPVVEVIPIFLSMSMSMGPLSAAHFCVYTYLLNTSALMDHCCQVERARFRAYECPSTWSSVSLPPLNFINNSSEKAAPSSFVYLRKRNYTHIPFRRNKLHNFHNY